ncbi:MAG: Txe/YoeB family addiction module toxin [Clostridia bacterium]
MNKSFTDLAWADYLYWEQTDKKTFRRINQLIKDIDRNGNSGIGKPEPLGYELQGFWSRRIDSEHRLVYTIMENTIHIVQCRYHYEK